MNKNIRYDDPDLAKQYELSGEGFEEYDGDISYYKNLLGKKGLRILELACGTGRLTLPIAQEGAEIVGLDLSASMLDIAREKARDQGLDVKFIHGDAADFCLNCKFDAIFITYNSISLIPNKKIGDFIVCCKKHLKSGGHFYFDIARLDLARFGNGCQWEVEVPTKTKIVGTQKEIKRKLKATLIPEQQVIEYVSEWIISDGFNTEIKHTPLMMSTWEPEQYIKEFESYGFTGSQINEHIFDHHGRKVRRAYSSLILRG